MGYRVVMVKNLIHYEMILHLVLKWPELHEAMAVLSGIMGKTRASATQEQCKVRADIDEI